MVSLLAGAALSRTGCWSEIRCRRGKRRPTVSAGSRLTVQKPKDVLVYLTVYPLLLLGRTPTSHVDYIPGIMYHIGGVVNNRSLRSDWHEARRYTFDSNSEECGIGRTSHCFPAEKAGATGAERRTEPLRGAQANDTQRCGCSLRPGG
jgi:hypothetical protein